MKRPSANAFVYENTSWIQLRPEMLSIAVPENGKNEEKDTVNVSLWNASGETIE